MRRLLPSRMPKVQCYDGRALLPTIGLVDRNALDISTDETVGGTSQEACPQLLVPFRTTRLETQISTLEPGEVMNRDDVSAHAGPRLAEQEFATRGLLTRLSLCGCAPQCTIRESAQSRFTRCSPPRFTSQRCLQEKYKSPFLVERGFGASQN